MDKPSSSSEATRDDAFGCQRPGFRAALRAHLAQLAHGLLERDTASRLVLLAALAGEHVLLIGPPGTAKSALARRLHRAFGDVGYLERLLTRFSTPEELFGPLSLKALEDDRYERLIEGFLPTVGIAFLDEVFKANSAILNALLTLLNEREFDNGTRRLRAPLISVIGASNEVPSDESLHAFYDRFLVRLPVEPVSEAAFSELLRLSDRDLAAPATSDSTPHPITATQRQALIDQAQTCQVSSDFLQACKQWRTALTERAITVSDRRWRQLVRLMRVAAASEGRDTLDAADLWLAPYVTAALPQDIATLTTVWMDDILRTPPASAPWLERAVEAFEKQLGIEEQMPAEDGDSDAGAGKMALARAIGLSSAPPDFADDNGAGGASQGPARIVSERVLARTLKHWSPVHIAARLGQLDEVLANVDTHLGQAREMRDHWAARFDQSLWLPDDLRRSVLDRHDQALGLLAHLSERLRQARAGFARLPVDEAKPAHAAPEPLAWAEA